MSSKLVGGVIGLVTIAFLLGSNAMAGGHSVVSEEPVVFGSIGGEVLNGMAKFALLSEGSSTSVLAGICLFIVGLVLVKKRSVKRIRSVSSSSLSSAVERRAQFTQRFRSK